MLLESFLGGLVLGGCVAYFLLRFFDKIPTKNPILKSIILSLIVMIIITTVIGGPSSYLATGNILRYFLIGTLFNLFRILTLGLGIGCLYDKLKIGAL
jgi:hypothetical protein